MAANNALRRGEIERGDCVDCGGEGQEMHHEDYSKPLDVTWLCVPCHVKRRGETILPNDTAPVFQGAERLRIAKPTT